MNRPTIRTLWLAGSLALLSHGSFAGAQQNCDQPRGSFDQVYCQVKVLVQADAELNTAYRQLLARLPAPAQQVLRQTQRARGWRGATASAWPTTRSMATWCTPAAP